MKTKKQWHIAYGIFIGLLIGILAYKSSLPKLWARLIYASTITRNACQAFFSYCGTNFIAQKNLLASLHSLQERYNQLMATHVALIHSLVKKKDALSVSEETALYNIKACHAKILFKKCSAYEQRIYIDRGSIHGIIGEMPVVYKTFLLGKVHKVYEWFSEVILINDIQSRVPALFNKTKIKGIIEGVNAIDQMRASFVEDVPELVTGLYAFSSGEGLVYPAGFCVGKIKEIIREGSIYATLVIEPLVDICTLDHCHLLFGQQEAHDTSASLAYILNLWDEQKLFNAQKDTSTADKVAPAEKPLKEHVPLVVKPMEPLRNNQPKHHTNNTSEQEARILEKEQEATVPHEKIERPVRLRKRQHNNSAQLAEYASHTRANATEKVNNQKIALDDSIRLDHAMAANPDRHRRAKSSHTQKMNANDETNQKVSENIQHDAHIYDKEDPQMPAVPAPYREYIYELAQPEEVQ